MTTYDTIIIGLGAMGNAVAYELANRGQRVLGIEQFKEGGHQRGSSHGESRIYRQAYFEGSAYVPMLLRAHEKWRQLERESGETLFVETGGLFMGLEDSELIRGSVSSCRAHNLTHELLDAAEIRRRYPLFQPPKDFVGLHERAAGFLHPERAVAASQQLARAKGAELHFNEAVQGIDVGPHITVTGKETYTAGHLIVTAGAWAGRLLPELASSLSVQRVPLHWFHAQDAWQGFTPDAYPVHAWDLSDYGIVYGPPTLDGRIKLAFHNHQQTPTDPEQVDRTVSAAEVEEMCRAIDPVMPGLCASHEGSQTCLYTMSPDEHFIIDRHPADERIQFAAGFSGHGFKFMPVIGEILADRAEGRDDAFDLEMFRLDRRLKA